MLCPVKAAWALWKAATANAPLCQLPSGKCLSSRTMSSVIKCGAKSLGEDPKKFGTHSLRSGGATAMFEAGIADTVIKQLGRWKSDCYQAYTRIEETTGARISRAMAQGQ